MAVVFAGMQEANDGDRPAEAASRQLALTLGPMRMEAYRSAVAQLVRQVVQEAEGLGRWVEQRAVEQRDAETVAQVRTSSGAPQVGGLAQLSVALQGLAWALDVPKEHEPNVVY